MRLTVPADSAFGFDAQQIHRGFAPAGRQIPIAAMRNAPAAIDNGVGQPASGISFRSP